VVANQTNTGAQQRRRDPNSSVTNPTIAFQGSGNRRRPVPADQSSTRSARPASTSPSNLRDLDGTTDNAVVPVGHCSNRIGNSGSFTNVPAGFVARRHYRPRAWRTLVTAVSASCPAAADNQSLVQVRITRRMPPASDETCGAK
jgi:hypothetical protein